MNMEQLNYEKIGIFIAERRKEKGMTQLQLAEVLGITDRAVSKWERAKSFPDVSLLKPLCEALDISVSELLDGEKKPQEALSRQEADEVVIKGIRAYLARLKGKQMRRHLIALCVVLVLCGGAFLWHAANQPIDFVKGNFAITKVEVRTYEGETYQFALKGEFAKETEKAIKAILADGQEYRTPVDDLRRTFGEPYIDLEGIGTFYMSGYIDEKNQEYYQFDFSELYDFVENCIEDVDYQYKGKTEFTWKDCTLKVSCPLTEKPQEVIVQDFLDDLKTAYVGYPEAYVKSYEILSIKRILPEDLEEEFYWEAIQKEIDYFDIYDYRIYEIIFMKETSNGGRTAQVPDGKTRLIQAVGDKKGKGNVETSGFELIFSNLAQHIE